MRCVKLFCPVWTREKCKGGIGGVLCDLPFVSNKKNWMYFRLCIIIRIMVRINIKLPKRVRWWEISCISKLKRSEMKVIQGKKWIYYKWMRNDNDNKDKKMIRKISKCAWLCMNAIWLRSIAIFRRGLKFATSYFARLQGNLWLWKFCENNCLYPSFDQLNISCRFRIWLIGWNLF